MVKKAVIQRLGYKKKVLLIVAGYLVVARVCFAVIVVFEPLSLNSSVQYITVTLRDLQWVLSSRLYGADRC